jgi:enoyl-CoA hydratase/carnithine racemase
VAQFVTLDISGDGVGTIRLDRPPVNALNAAVAAELGDAVDAAAVDGSVRAVVVSGGDNVFAAGADVKEMIGLDPISMYTYIGRFQDALTRLESLPVVTIAAINGYALGGGCEVALACDLRICADDSQLGQPETTLGIIPGAGGTQRLPRLIGEGRAKELIYSGRFVGAEEAHAIGLVNEVHPAAEVPARAEELARRYAEGPGVALRAAKEVIQRGMETDLATGLLIEKQAFASLFATEDQQAGMSSFLQKGPGRARFAGR